MPAVIVFGVAFLTALVVAVIWAVCVMTRESGTVAPLKEEAPVLLTKEETRYVKWLIYRDTRGRAGTDPEDRMYFESVVKPGHVMNVATGVCGKLGIRRPYR